MSVTFLVVGGGLLKQNLALRAVVRATFWSFKAKLGTETCFQCHFSVNQSKIWH